MELSDFVQRAEAAEKKLLILSTRAAQLEGAVAAMENNKQSKQNKQKQTNETSRISKITIV
jgi:hypothetical protein